MRAIRLSFFHMLKFIRHDMMLFAAGLAPVLAGMAIKFLVPFIEKTLTRFWGADAVLTPYYGLIDCFFASIAPVMFCFVAAMVILEEHDDHIDRYLFVTGLGRNGYILSRILMPAFCAFLVTLLLLPIFCLTNLPVIIIVFLAFGGTLQGIMVALMVVTLSSNKLEGMAVTKLSTLMILGAVVPYFVPVKIGFIFSFLPSFWMGKTVFSGNGFYMLPTVLTAGIWIFVLQRKFSKKF